MKANDQFYTKPEFEINQLNAFDSSTGGRERVGVKEMVMDK